MWSNKHDVSSKYSLKKWTGSKVTPKILQTYRLGWLTFDYTPFLQIPAETLGWRPWHEGVFRTCLSISAHVCNSYLTMPHGKSCPLLAVASSRKPSWMAPTATSGTLSCGCSCRWPSPLLEHDCLEGRASGLCSSGHQGLAQGPALENEQRS